MSLFKDFLNICQYKLRALSSKSLYPTSILPKIKYVKTIDIDILNDECKTHICRRIENASDAFIRPNRFRDDVWKSEKLQGMSWNLLGNKFIPEYNAFNPINFGSEDWNGERRINPLDTLEKENFEPKENITTAYLPLTDIHNLEIPMTISGAAQKEFLEKTQIEPSKNSNGGIDVKGSAVIEHRPTNFNYWHVQFLLKDYKAEEMPKEVKQSTVKKFLRDDILSKLAKPIMKFENAQIVEKHYFKTNT